MKNRKRLTKPCAGHRVKVWPHDSPHVMACKEAWNGLMDAFENRESVEFRGPTFYTKAGQKLYDDLITEETRKFKMT